MKASVLPRHCDILGGTIHFGIAMCMSWQTLVHSQVNQHRCLCVSGNRAYIARRASSARAMGGPVRHWVPCDVYDIQAKSATLDA